MELLTEALKQPFIWGLLLGLLITFFIWKGGYARSRRDAREIKRLETEIKDLQGHLNTQLKINATGNEALQTELETLRRQTENLRIQNSALQQKPGRAEQRQFQLYDMAVRAMREQAPGFAPAWEKALRQAESELDAAESGLRKLVRKVIPSIGGPAAAQTEILTTDDSTPHG
jgi:regulator of replication initiation timing